MLRISSLIPIGEDCTIASSSRIIDFFSYTILESNSLEFGIFTDRFRVIGNFISTFMVSSRILIKRESRN